MTVWEHGRWRMRHRNGRTAYICSRCGTTAYFEYSYCPFCSAVMDEDDFLAGSDTMDVINLPGGKTVTMEQVQEAVNEGLLPVKHGKWEVWHDFDGWEMYACSLCGKEMPTGEYDYCPGCGAVMDTEDEE